MSEQKKEIKRPLYRKVINSIIITFAVFFLLFVLLFGFSQTTTFRDYLNEEVTTLVNDAINGSVSIGEINGTLLTSFDLEDITIYSERDTLAELSHLKISINPLQLLLKKVYIRDLIVEGVSFRMYEYKEGGNNLSYIFSSPPDTTSLDTLDETLLEEELEIEDSTGSSQLRLIYQIANIDIKDVEFIKQKEANKGKYVEHEYLDTDDLWVKDFEFNARVAADIDNSDIYLQINHISAKPNIKNFLLDQLKGKFRITEKYAEVRELNIQTPGTDLELSARMDSLNLFGDLNTEYFRDYPSKVNVVAKSFDFDDLTAMIKSTKMLKGQPSLILKAEGSYADLDIEKLEIGYNNTRLDMKGEVENLHIASELYLNVEMENSSVDYSDVLKLLPTLDLPKFPGANLDNFNLWMKGEPTRFNAGIVAETGEGQIDLVSFLSLQDEEMQYNVDFALENFNAQPFIDIPTSVNAVGKVEGVGTDPVKLNSICDITATNTKFGDYRIDSLRFYGRGRDKYIDVDIDTKVNDGKYKVAGYFDYTDTNTVSYLFDGSVDSLNLVKMVDSSLIPTNYNFDISLEGSGVNPDSLNARLGLVFRESFMDSVSIGEPEINLSVEKISDTRREIKLVSDFLDFNANGEFSIENDFRTIGDKSSFIVNQFLERVLNLNPVKDSTQTVMTDEVTEPDSVENIKPFNLKFDYEVKDLSVITKLIGEERFNLLGYGKGAVKNDSSNFALETNFYLDYLVNRNVDDIIFLSDIEVNFDFNKRNNAEGLDGIFGAVSVTGQRVLAGAELRNIEADLVFNDRKMFYNTSVNIDQAMDIYLSGQFNKINNERLLTISDFSFDFRDNEWTNRSEATINLGDTLFSISDLEIVNEDAELLMEGNLNNKGDLDFSLLLNGLTGTQLNGLMMAEDFLPEGTISSSAKIEGNLYDPVVFLKFFWNDVTYNNSRLGRLESDFIYRDEYIFTDIAFLKDTSDARMLRLNGGVPVYLGIDPERERFPSDEEVELYLTSQDFQLNTLGNTVPFISNQSGILAALVDLRGPWDNLRYNGELTLENAKFKGDFNGLDYEVSAKTYFNENTVDIEYLKIKNGGEVEVQNIGEMVLTGSVNTDNLALDKMNLNVTGDLTVLSEESRGVSPYVYGDLFVGTEGNWQFSYQNGRPFFKGSVLLKSLDLTYSQGPGSYTSSSRDMLYTFVKDSSDIDQQQLKLEKLLDLDKDKEKEEEEQEFSDIFDYDLELKVVESGQLEFLLARVSNYKLSAEINDGSLSIKKIGDDRKAQGTFTLLDGSRLELFKVLEASGSIRFENDLTDPYLYITAFYQNEYINPPNYPNETVDVAVEIKMQGTMEELGEDLANPDNISVYIGARNISNRTADRSYDVSDALSFILIGKFKEDLTPADKSRVAAETGLIENATNSLLSSVLTAYFNSTFGDYINNIQLSQTSTNTKFSVSGKIERFRYSIGGTTELFENLNKANLRLAYNISNNLLIRLERKNPVISNTGLEDKVSELGLQYRFEF